MLQKAQRELRKTLFRLSQVVTDGNAENIELVHMRPKEIDLEPMMPIYAYVKLSGHRPPCNVQMDYIEPGDIKVFVSNVISRPSRDKAQKVIINPQRFTLNPEKNAGSFDSEFAYFTFLSSYGCMFRITAVFKGDF